MLRQPPGKGESQLSVTAPARQTGSSTEKVSAMKLTRSAAIALSVTAPQADHAAATSVAVYNCGNKPLVEPHTFVFTCDSTGYLAYTEMTFLFPGHSIRSHNTESLVPPGVFPGES